MKKYEIKAKNTFFKIIINIIIIIIHGDYKSRINLTEYIACVFMRLKSRKTKKKLKNHKSVSM